MTMPVLLKNARMADAKPRRSTGTAAMIALVFGGWKRPDPNPCTNIQNAIMMYGVSYCMKASPTSPTVDMMSPAVLMMREPYLSESDPPSGPVRMRAIASGDMRMLAQSGSYPLGPWKKRINSIMTAPRATAFRRALTCP